MEIALADETQPVPSGSGGRQWLLTAAGEDGLRFRYMRTTSPGDAPIHVARHHHPFAQVRWAEKGARSIGIDQYIPEGAIAYFPRAAYYGPELLNADPSGVILSTLQFGFGPEYSHIPGELPPLNKNGERVMPDGEDAESQFAGSERDPDFPTDQFGVPLDNWRKTPRPVRGQVVGAQAIPPQLYDSVVLMYPQAVAYHEIAPGVELKHLGKFFDHPGPNGDTGISMLRLSDDGVHTLTAERAQLFWSTSPGLKLDGRVYPAITNVYSPRGEEAVLSGIDNVEVYVITFPRPD